MKSLGPNEFWNSEVRKLTWCIYRILCNTLSGMWGQYSINERVNISEAAKWLNSNTKWDKGYKWVHIGSGSAAEWVLKNKLPLVFRAFLDFGIAGKELYTYIISLWLVLKSFFSYVLILCPTDLLPSQTQHA